VARHKRNISASEEIGIRTCIGFRGFAFNIELLRIGEIRAALHN
jgi:hypothetical protein